MKKKSKLILLIYFGFWLIYFAYFWSQAIAIEPSGKLFARHGFLWGDWAAHLTMTTRMAYGESLILSRSPFFITYPFGYPFVADLVSAILIKLNFSMVAAMIFTSFSYCFLGTILLFIFLKRLFKSTATGIIGSLLFYLNGGMGFIMAWPDLKSATNLWAFLNQITQKYTHHPQSSLHLINIIESMFIPQRAFTLGFPVTLLILILLLKVIRANFKSNKPTRKTLLIKGLFIGSLIGAMPIIHTHSFLALFIILASWSLSSFLLASSKKKTTTFSFWAVLVMGCLVIAVPLYYYFFAENIHQNFMSWYPGWYAREDQISWLWFWFWNWGLTPVFGLISYGWIIFKALKNKTKSLIQQVWLLAPFWIIFILINLIKFQPNIWDNTKLWAWSSVGISGLAGYLYVSLWKYTAKFKTAVKVILKILLTITFSISILSSSLDLFSALNFKHHSYEMYSAEELVLTEWVKENTPNDSVWLTSDKHNHWLDNLTGRQALMGYRGWLWTHGYQYQPVEKDMAQMFEHPKTSQNIFEKYGVDYVVIGPNEKSQWHANQAEFDQFTLIKSSSNYKIYSL